MERNDVSKDIVSVAAVLSGDLSPSGYSPEIDDLNMIGVLLSVDC